MSSYLPQEIISNILSRLPVKCLLRFKCVSKPWRSLLSDPNFIKSHLNRAIQSDDLHFLFAKDSTLYSMDRNALPDKTRKIDFQISCQESKIHISGSCNGLLCITASKDSIFLVNPCTKEFKKIERQHFDTPWGCNMGSRVTFYGFGYDPKIDDYKVVRIVYSFFGDLDFDYEFKVYTLGENSWRRIDYNPDYVPYNDEGGVSAGVLVNGALHWLVRRISDDWGFIAALDLVSEEFKDVSLPDDLNDEWKSCLGVLEGSLCVFDNSSAVQAEVWLMKENSWTKLFTIPKLQVRVLQYECFKPLCFSKKGEVFMEKEKKALMVYDPKRVKGRTLRIRGFPKTFETETYVGSLVSVKSDTFFGKKWLLAHENKRIRLG